MRFAILGAGALGSILGAHLARAGHNLDGRPSQGCARVADILAWFERNDAKAVKSASRE